MPPTTPEPNSSDASRNQDLDLDLPVFDQPMPAFHPMTLEESMILHERIWAETTYDAAYFAESLARKNDVPFEM